MKVYEMLQALEIVNQLNNALGQNEQCLKIYLEHGDERIQINALNLFHYHTTAKKNGLDSQFIANIASVEYDNNPVKVKYNGVEWEMEIYSGYDWECE